MACCVDLGDNPGTRYSDSKATCHFGVPIFRVEETTSVTATHVEGLATTYTFSDYTIAIRRMSSD